MARAVASLGLGQIAVAGINSGACWAAHLAAHLGAGCGRLVLIDPPTDPAALSDRLPATALAPCWSGAHLLTTWHLARESLLYRPWFTPTNGARIPVEIGFDVDLLHQRFVDTVIAGEAFPETVQAVCEQPWPAMLAPLAGRVAVVTGEGMPDAAERTYYAHDIAGPASHAPELVVRPPSVGATVACVAAITGAGHALTVRGGGHSYTGGYGPTRPGTVILDMSALDRVVEIDEADGWVTTEAGCTWRTLHDALAAVGRRTPFFGPLSGIVATVGGAASQNAAFFGSARHGPMSASVLGLDVVTADGTLIRLGSVGDKGFARDFGPDPVGLFLAQV